jgi:hypothetical protein
MPNSNLRRFRPAGHTRAVTRAMDVLELIARQLPHSRRSPVCGLSGASVRFLAPSPDVAVSSTFSARVSIAGFHIMRRQDASSQLRDGHLGFALDDGRFDQPRYSGTNGRMALRFGVNGFYSPAYAPGITYMHIPKGTAGQAPERQWRADRNRGRRERPGEVENARVAAAESLRRYRIDRNEPSTEPPLRDPLVKATSDRLCGNTSNRDRPAPRRTPLTQPDLRACRLIGATRVVSESCLSAARDRCALSQRRSPVRDAQPAPRTVGEPNNRHPATGKRPRCKPLVNSPGLGTRRGATGAPRRPES